MLQTTRRWWRVTLLGVLLTVACTSPTAPPPTGPNATITGTVVERVDGAPYSFLRLETERGMTWVAVPMADVPKKARATVKNGATLKNFESKQAGRRFDAVVFGVLEKG
jgi:hypothetical protein